MAALGIVTSSGPAESTAADGDEASEPGAGVVAEELRRRPRWVICTSRGAVAAGMACWLATEQLHRKSSRQLSVFTLSLLGKLKFETEILRSQICVDVRPWVL